METNKIGIFMLAMLTVVLIAIVVALPVQLLWNHCLISAVDGVNPIGFWQAFGLYMMASLLFKKTTNK